MDQGHGHGGKTRPPVSRTDVALGRGRVFALASVLAVAPMISGLPQSAPVTPHPVQSHVREVALVRTSPATMRAAAGATRSVQGTPGAPDPISTARSGAMTPAQAVTSAVTVVGVTWPNDAVSAEAQFQIRTLTAGTWSQWQQLDGDQNDGPDPKEAARAAIANGVAAGGTSPYVVTGASHFQVRALTTDPTAPTAATVQVIDPGTSGADSNQQAAGAAAAASARPFIQPRAAWGANESMRREAPDYGQVQLAFVHHTVSANTYTAAEVPAMIRGIYAYHVQTLGWSDIGYNFLVDRFGRTWEGRFGGTDKSVVGAQTTNYNSTSTGVSAIGNYEIAAVPKAVTDAIMRILAWKLSLTGSPAIGTVPSLLTPSWSRTTAFERISGHRDGFQTACPGRNLYAKLPEIRAGAQALIAAAPRTPAPAPLVSPAPSPVVKLAPKPVVTATPQPAVRPSAAATRYTPYKAVVVRQGSRGAAVVVLQRALKVPSDGAFGPNTRVALTAFQTKQRLTRNGTASPAVWNLLERRDYPLIAYRRLSLRQGSKGAAVTATQRALRIRPDGIFGARTAVAVKAVQLKAKLARTGTVSGWTWVAIENRMPR